VVAQTTQNAGTFLEIGREAAKRYKDCIVFDTLCNSTHQRQEEVRELAEQADAVVVVGGYNSANTNRLADIARSTGVPTFHVESAEELPAAQIDRFRNVAVTAGASTPTWLIQGVVEAIDRAQQQHTPALARAFVHGLRFFQDSGVHIAIGAALLTYASCLLQELPVLPEYLILAFAYVFAMQHLMYFTDRAAAMYNEPTRALFYERHKVLIISVAAAGAVTALAFSAILGLDTFGLMVLATAAGVAYNARIVPEKLVRFVRYRRPKDVPASRDIFAGLGWAVVTVAVPFLHASPSLAGRNVVAFFFVFAIAFIRSVIVDVKHIQGDRVVGNETIPIIIGKQRTKVMLGALAALTAGVLVVAAQRGVVSSLGIYLLSCIAYACMYLYLYHERIIFQGISFEGVVDSNYWLAGIVAFVWRLSQPGLSF
jgi:4-hydroxybenzoate polyprenyltransferase